jgi:cytochrome b561
MVSLEYHDPLYNSLPHYHKSIGILFALFLGIRITWSSFNPTPTPVPGVRKWEFRLARLVQIMMLGTLVIVVFLGYLISTAKGGSIQVFNWFAIPASITSIENQEDLAGELHFWFASSVIFLAGFHTLAALKHHFFRKNTTLSRMLSVSRN